MEQLVKFRMQTSTLSLDEYRSFLFDVLDESTMEEFSCMIFKHLHHKSKKHSKQINELPSNGLQINKINHVISTIVSQRNDIQSDPDDEETDEAPPAAISPPPIKLNITNLTDVLIQEIASFLPFKSYSTFQLCSRSIFYAANTPSTLYELDNNIDFETICKSDATSFMKRFARVQKLMVDSSNEKCIPLTRYRNLKHLCLRIMDIQSYLSQNVFTWNKIETLYLDMDHDVGHVVEIVKRCQNLSSLIMIVEAGDLDDRSEIMHHQLADLVSKSNIICLGMLHFDQTGARIVLQNICHKLKSLTIGSPENVDGMTFDNLIELYLLSPEATVMSSIIKTTKHLKRLGMSITQSTMLTDNDFKLAFGNIFDLDTLEYCHIRCLEIKYLSLLTSLIETSFRKKRDRFKLKITGLVHGTVTLGVIHGMVLRIFHTLCNWCKCDFMLLVELCTHGKQVSETVNDLQKWLNEISNSFSVYIDKELRGPIPRFIISNKGNTFDGYKEKLIAPSWLNF
eukprot:915505_1